MISNMNFGQTSPVNGVISFNDKPLPFTQIAFTGSQNITTTSDSNGVFNLEIPFGSYKVMAEAMGLKIKTQTIEINSSNSSNLKIIMVDDLFGLDEVVISATRNRVQKKEAPIIVNTLGEKLLQATQALAVSDALQYTPGVRVENNCQNCGFTQVRLNGLDGGYSQILVNSRAVFSALNSVYGLEQIPAQIIDRVEIVRSGGSALFGSNAIAGTINIITKDPILNSWEVGNYFGIIDGNTPDNVFNFNTSLVSDNLKSGATFYGTHRNRNSWDANNDGFTETVKIKNTIFGKKIYVKPTDLSRLTFDATVINEDRRGGDRLDLAPHLTDITENLRHNTIMGGLNYDFTNQQKTNQYAIYSSVQYTNRDSYYGGLGGGRTAQDTLTALNAYGKTKDLAWVNGFQLIKNISRNILTTGIEHQISTTKDEIAGYFRLIDQSVKTTGLYAQFEWKPTSKFSALMGSRLDYVHVKGNYKVGDIQRTVTISELPFNPRLTLSYTFTDDLKFRGGYARGFRAPQAFNEDLHIASVGGEPQFVILSNHLEPEYSDAFTGSFNFTKDFNTTQTNFLMEGFYTRITNPFTLISTGVQFENGSILEEVRNGEAARVYGANFEFGVSPSKKWLVQIGGTLQRTGYQAEQLLFEADGTNPAENDILISEFIRNPNVYGYLNTNWTPNNKFNMTVTGTFTGKMTVPLVVSNTGFLKLNESPAFFDLNLTTETQLVDTPEFKIVLNTGIKNLFNSFQNDFQSGPNRDSEYVYGPTLPRTLFLGFKIKTP